MEKGRENKPDRSKTPRAEIRVLLDNIRSTHNVGSIIRTSDAAGVLHIYCVGTTPAPIDRFGRKRKDVTKVSLGAEESVPWSHVESSDCVSLVKKLKKEGLIVIALEQSSGSVDYRDVRVQDKALIMLGNEVGGVSKKILDLADIIAEIPMAGQKESLNVSVAAGVALFSLIGR